MSRIVRVKNFIYDLFGVRAGSADLVEAELETIDDVVAGTVTANKAIVAGASKNLDVLVVAQLNGITVGSVETLTGAGAISITTAHTNLVTTGANALTLAAPGSVTEPFFKTIHMTTDGGDGTLASTNIVGQSSGTTSITFNDAGDYLILVAIPGKNKWSVVKEGGVTSA